MTDLWQDFVWAATRDMGARIAAFLPGLLAMLTFLALGALLGWVASAILTRLARAVDFDRRSETWGLTTVLARAGIGRAPSQIVGLLAFWGLFAIFATMGIDALAFPGAPATTGLMVQLLERLLAAGLILVVGWLVANFLGQGVLIAAVNAGVPEARHLARAARWGVLLFAIATTLTQLGIGKEMVLVTFTITFGGLIFALALAFGLGGRALAREILERKLGREQEPHPRETIAHL
ncbi:MAG: hypothetical protein HY278_06260 [candidate division NC10 bacterium]|nr:hypothetical protein [candidate division NC10 bacterium]